MWKMCEIRERRLGLTHERVFTLKQLVVYSSGGPETEQVNAGARRKYQIFKYEQRLCRNLQEVVSRFAHTAVPCRQDHASAVCRGKRRKPEILRKLQANCP